MKGIGLFWRTVRHLTARQLAYQVLNRLRGRAKVRLSSASATAHFLAVPNADKPVSLVNGTFLFLNKSHSFPRLIDWNFADYGKLWTYHLNYFDFLNQPGMDAQTGLTLIRSFMAQSDRLTDGLEPYPASLRIANWVQFLSRNQFRDAAINRHLYAQTHALRRRLEYHIAGNHLLENGFALLTAALFFREDAWFRQATRLVRAELSAQLLADGGHDERSPMYHQLLLDRLLDVRLALRHDTWHIDRALLDFLDDRAARMLGWLVGITFRNGDVPMMNDAVWSVAPTTAQLREKAGRVGLLNDSWVAFPQAMDHLGTVTTGYRKFTFPRYELLADVGAIGPDHQPGHAHADTFSLVLYVDNQPLIVDSGTSTYEPGPRRAWERSTAAHNTVDAMSLNSSEVWAGFRVGRRARTTVSADTPARLTARHDGYRHLGIVHERTWSVGPMHIWITDRLVGTKTAVSPPQTGTARLHFHPDVLVRQVGPGIEAGAMHITFVSVPAPELRLTTYEVADGFNRLRAALCAEITFTNQLETVLIPIP